MSIRSLSNVLRTGALLCSVCLATSAARAQAAQQTITLDPGSRNPATEVTVQGEASFANPPANFYAFTSARAGSPGSPEEIRLRFAAPTTLLGIQSTKDFPIEPGGSCAEGRSFAAGDTCVLFVRFTPQGAGRRLGRLTITHSGSPEPAALGLGGYGYAPIVSFTPAAISTVPGTYPSNTGLLSAAQNLTVDGSDTLYIADTGNGIIRYLDSSGTFKSLATGYTSPLGIAVDTFGEVYFDEPAAGVLYEIYDYGPVVTISGSTTGSTCTVSTPCTLGATALENPGMLSMDQYNQLFFPEETHGAVMATVQPVPATMVYLYNPFPYQDSPTTAMAADADGEYLYTLWATSGNCEIQQQSLYDAENSIISFSKVAGGRTCGLSGGGGQAGNAEIGSVIGQMAFDVAGNLYFTDNVNQKVRRISYATGIISGIAGSGVAGYTGDGGEATAAELSYPTGLAVDSQGQVYIISGTTAAKGGAQVVRKLGPNGNLAFGNEPSGSTSAAQIVTVSNVGNYPAVLTSYFFGGADPTDFSIDPKTTSCLLTAGSSLPAGQQCQVGVLFKPGATGARSGTLVFVDNTVNSSNTVILSGTGTAALVTVTPGAVTFPATTPAQSATAPVTLTNTGNADLTISAISIGGANPAMFSYTNGCGAGPIAPKAACTVQVTFKPAAAASYSAAIKITDNAADSPQSITMTGTGRATYESTVNLSSSANPATTCKPVAFTITVRGSGGGVPTGIVELKKGTSVVGLATLSNGSATFSTTALAVGANLLTASYEGDATHAASTSSVLTQMVATGQSCLGVSPGGGR